MSLLVLVTALALDTPVHSQGPTWPPKVVKIIVPLTPGGGNDTVARMFARYLEQKYKTSFIVDARAGAGGSVAMELLAKAAPDGATLGIISTSTQSIFPLLRSDLLYDVDKSVDLIALLSEFTLALVVNPAVPAKSIRELVDYARANPDRLTFGSGGAGTSVHLAGAIFNNVAGIKARHIPFRGTSEYVAALMGGHIDYAIGALINVAEPARAGKLRVIAVTSAARVAQLPDVPAIAEVYPGYVSVPWAGLAAPAGTPTTILHVLAADARAFLEAPSTLNQLAQLWAVPHWLPGEGLRARIAAERASYASVLTSTPSLTR